jgi:4-carboxymuconolactone decarboxylase
MMSASMRFTAIRGVLFASVLLIAWSPRLAAQDRLPAIPAEKLTDAQERAVAEFKALRKVDDVFGPFVPLLRSPELMSRASAMGEYLRFRSSLPLRLSEFAILIAARQWTSQYAWQVHYPIAMKAGLSPAVALAIAEGRRPEGMIEDEAIVHDFSLELHRNQSVSDATYARALARFGEQGVIDTIGIAGYYTLLAMVMNGTRTAVPVNPAVPFLPPLPR